MLGAYKKLKALVEDVSGGSIPGVTVDYLTNSMSGIQSFIIYAPQVAQLAPSEFIYIHSSAPTGSWDIKKGGTSDLLAVLPWNKGFGDTPSFQANRVQDTTYAAIANMNTLKSF